MAENDDLVNNTVYTEPFTSIASENLFSFAQKVKPDLPNSATIYNYLVMHARGVANTSSFFVLKDDPHSTIVLSQDHVEREIFLYCRKSEVNRLTEALKKTSVIDWLGSLVFRFVPDYLTEALKEVAREKQLQELYMKKFHFYVYRPQEDFELRCGKGLRVARMGKAVIHHIAKVGKKDRGIIFPLEQMLRLVTLVPTTAIYLDSSSEEETAVDIGDISFVQDDKLPICRVTPTLYGALGFLRTESEYRGRGLAKLALQVVARLLEAEGYTPYCYTRPETAAFFEKTGDWREFGLAYVYYSQRPT